MHSDDSNYHSIEAKPHEESLVSKLLRWLTASVILGKISCKSSELNNGSFSERPTLNTLLTWFRCPEKEIGENAVHGCKDILAASLFYLIQLLDFGDRLLPSAVSAICLLSGSSESENLVGLETSLPSLCSKTHCPAEANPAWRWSYYQPWRDLTVQLGDVEKLDEIQACERLLMVASNILLHRYGCSHFFQLKDVDSLNLQNWEKNMLQS